MKPIYNACGLAETGIGACVSIVRLYRVPIILADGQLNPKIQQIVAEKFLWRGIQVDPAAPAITVRFRSANNYYLSSGRALLRLYARGGFYGRALEPELFIPKGEAITIEAENQTGAAVNTFVVLAGVDLAEVN